MTAISRHRIFELWPMALAIVTLGSAACSDIALDIGPDASQMVVELANPSLQSLVIDDGGFLFGALLIQAKPSDPAFEPLENSRIEVRVTTDRGEQEDLLIGPWVCDRSEEGTRHCDRILVTVDDDVRDLVYDMGNFAGRLVSASYDLRQGTVLFFTGSVEAAIQSAKGWPGVRRAEEILAEINVAMVVLSRWIRTNEMRGGGLLRYEAPVPNDGVVQVLDGDEIQIEYRQPDGSVLTAAVRVECPQPDPQRLGHAIPLVSPCR